MRIAFVSVSHFPCAVEVQRSPHLGEESLIVGDAEAPKRVLDCSAAAAGLGVHPGMQIRKALALSPDATVLPPDPVLYRATWEATLDALHSISPEIEDEELGRAYLNIDGLGRHFQDENDLAAHLAITVRAASGLQAAIGLADGKFPAFAVAHNPTCSPAGVPIGTPGSAAAYLEAGGTPDPAKGSPGSPIGTLAFAVAHFKPGSTPNPAKDVTAGRPIGTPASAAAITAASPTVPAAGLSLAGSGVSPALEVPPGGEAAFLAPLDVGLLPVNPEIVSRLRLFGLQTIGEVAALTLPELQSQFGFEGKRLWQLVNGIDEAPLKPRPIEERVEAALSFEAPVTGIDVLVAAAKQLLSRLRLPLRGRAARELALQAELVSGRGWERRLVLREAVSDNKRLSFVLRESLQNAPPPNAVRNISLRLGGLTGETGKQLSLGERGRLQRQLEESIRQLKARYGYSPVFNCVDVEPWSAIPEQRQILVESDA